MKIKKIVSIVFSIIGCTVGGLISLIYLVTNVRLLFSGDWLIYAVPVSGFFNILFRVLMYAFILFFSILTYLYLFNKKVNKHKLFYFICAIDFWLVALLNMILNKITISGGIEGYISLIFKTATIFTIFGSLFSYLSLPTPNKEEKKIESEIENSPQQ